MDIGGMMNMTYRDVYEYIYVLYRFGIINWEQWNKASWILYDRCEYDLDKSYLKNI